MDGRLAAESRARRTRRVAELVWHLTETNPLDVLEVVQATDVRRSYTAATAIDTAAHAMVVLDLTAPRPVRFPGYLRRRSVPARTPVPHHTSLRRWDRSTPPDERARAFVEAELARVRAEIASRSGSTLVVGTG
jgi:hypothetical protein